MKMINASYGQRNKKDKEGERERERTNHYTFLRNCHFLFSFEVLSFFF